MIPILILIAGLMIVIERFWPGQSLPTVKGWWLRILCVNLAQLGIVLVAGVAWDRWLESVSMFALTDTLGTVGAASVAYLISTLVYYAWHRVRHESDFFWKLCHQLHHSPRRIEVLASFYKHPVEILINSWISALLVYGLLGLSLESAIEFIADDEIVEITPQSIRIRKRHLKEHERKRAARADVAA